MDRRRYAGIDEAQQRAAELQFDFTWGAAAEEAKPASPKPPSPKPASPPHVSHRGGAEELDKKADEAEDKARRAEQRVLNAETRLKQFNASSVTALKLKCVAHLSIRTIIHSCLHGRMINPARI